jgi:hypothetical protein
MAVDPKSLLDVFNNLREFFAQKMHRPKSQLFLGTNVRQGGNFTTASWVQLRTELADLDWMQKHGVVLSAAEMRLLSTLSDLSMVIWDEINDTEPAAG